MNKSAKIVSGILLALTFFLSGCGSITAGEVTASDDAVATALEADTDASETTVSTRIDKDSLNHSGDWVCVEKSKLPYGNGPLDVKSMVIYRHIPTGTMMATTITNQSGWTVLPFTWEEYQAALMQ